jgi:uncharacterized protein (TIGR02646 family)
MRKIEKSPEVPVTLVSAPIPTSADDVKESIYKADDVRNQLVIDQHCKCAYCESSITLKFNDVEHFRPKSHYYWLGHEWKNLLYSCPRCNRIFKNDSFPLKCGSIPANSPHDDIELEHPLIINPAEVDPSIHIKFRRHIAVGLTPEGLKTIEIFHLNDGDKCSELLNNREIKFEKYNSELKKIRLLEAIQKRKVLTKADSADLSDAISLCRQSIEKMTSLDEAFSGMLISQCK